MNDDLLARYQKMIEISRDLVSTLNMDQLLEKIVHAAAELCNAEAASILLYDKDRQALFFQAATNMEEPFMRGIVVPMDSIAGWVVLNKKPVIIHSKQPNEKSLDDRHFGEVLEGFTTRSMLGVPILIQKLSHDTSEEEVIGALEVLNKLEGDFDQQDQDLISAFSAYAAVAIENTHLFQQSDFIAEFVHELRAPLAALSNAAYILRKIKQQDQQNGQSPSEIQERALQTIISEADYLFELSDNYLNLARLESRRVKYQANTFLIHDLLQECISFMNAKVLEKQQRLSLAPSDSSIYIKADRAKIKQVIINLLSNAIKYTPPQGTIEIEAKTQADEILIIVRDNGCGIPPEAYNEIFKKYYRVPGTEKLAIGTGLGLAICKKIIEAHRGRIEVKSSYCEFDPVSHGTEITIYLPLLTA